jgi:hypothetical protein
LSSYDSLIMNQYYYESLRETHIIEQKTWCIRLQYQLQEIKFSNYQEISIFGLIIDTVSLKSFWEEKVEKIVTLGNIILRKREITVRTFASFIGLVILVNCITEI